jgi:putative nucleotidyltransferase with HDIG domain
MISNQVREKLRSSLRIKLLIVFSAVLLVMMMFPKGASIESDVTVGSIWIQNDLIASKTFEVLKADDLYKREIEQAQAEVHQIFILQKDALDRAIDSMRNYNKILLKNLDESIASQGEVKNSTFLSDEDFNEFKKLRISESTVTTKKTKNLTSFFNDAENLLKIYYQQGLLSIPYNQIEKDSIAIREGKFEHIVAKTDYRTPDSSRSFIYQYFKSGNEAGFAAAASSYISKLLVPGILFDSELTDEAFKMARERVPRNVGIVNENEKIVSKHDRITPEIKLKIDSYRIAKGEETGFWGRLVQNLGKFFHIALIFSLFWIYIFLFRKRIFRDNVKMLLLAIVILIIAVVTYLFSQIESQVPIEFLIFVPVASMLITIIFDSRVGFYGTVIISLIIGALRGNDYGFAVMNIIAGALAAYTVRDIKNRTQIFRSFFFILIGYSISIIAFGLERFDTFNQILVMIAFAAVNALISPVLTYGLIIFFERFFKITTDLTLLELSDFNRPLLRELARIAPGTFNHSMTIGTMVVSAAEAIHASPILARVGAYYHDVGKTLDPGSFVENQIEKENIHEKLPPLKSVEIIVNHVKRGIELAQEHDLPQDIIDFIPMHHGTLVVSYFYEKAKEELGEAAVNENDFRYPGPKPNTKETALVMLADACESTVRSISEPDTVKLENVINNLFRIRIEDGQLDEAPLTLNDIKKIKEAFLSILIGQYHKRIRYPNQSAIESDTNEKEI